MSANEIRIETVSGPNPVRVTLRGRAMPYRGMSTGGKQRVVTTWYQGNPKATQQIMGTELEPTILEGTWKSKFIKIGSNDPNVDVEVEGDLAAGIDFGRVAFDNPASAVVTLFERIRDQGRELRFSWGDTVRFGILTDFIPTWDRFEDVAWSITFDWNGRVERAPRMGAVTTFGQPVQRAMVDTDNALVRLPTRTITQSAATRLLASMNDVRARAIDLLAYARQATSTITLPLRVVQGAAGIAIELKNVATDVTLQCLGVPYELFTTFDTVIDVFNTEDYRRTVGSQVSVLTARAIDERNRMRDVSSTMVNATPIRVTQRTSLRTLAATYYGSEADWTVIAEANGLNQSFVEAGTLVFIPQKTATSKSDEAVR